MPASFKEIQRFSPWIQWTISLVLVPLGLLTLYGSYQQIIVGVPFGTKPGSDSALIIITLFSFSFVLLFQLLHLKTTIDHSKITIYFFPFTKRTLHWSEILRADIIDYGFVFGWGIRLTHKHGTVYNTKGRIDLALQLKKRQKINHWHSKKNRTCGLFEREQIAFACPKLDYQR